MSSVLIIYATTGGNTELTVDKVSEILQNAGHDVTIKRAEQSTVNDFANFDALVFASSTYGEGLLQEFMEPLYIEVKKLGLKGKKCAVIGLGDNKYNVEYIIEAANILEKMVKDSGGTLVLPPLRINKTPVTYLTNMIKSWAENLSKAI